MYICTRYPKLIDKKYALCCLEYSLRVLNCILFLLLVYTHIAGPPPPQQQFDYRQDPSPQSRRHPDFTKESQYPPGPPAVGPYNQRPQLYPSWPAAGGSPGHYNRQYPPQQWGNQRIPGPPVGMGAVPGPPVQNAAAQWEPHRYPQQNAQPPYPGEFQTLFLFLLSLK